jgi:hypothetical protein
MKVVSASPQVEERKPDFGILGRFAWITTRFSKPIAENQNACYSRLHEGFGPRDLLVHPKRQEGSLDLTDPRWLI